MSAVEFPTHAERRGPGHGGGHAGREQNGVTAPVAVASSRQPADCGGGGLRQQRGRCGLAGAGGEGEKGHDDARGQRGRHEHEGRTVLLRSAHTLDQPDHPIHRVGGPPPVSTARGVPAWSVVCRSVVCRSVSVGPAVGVRRSWRATPPSADGRRGREDDGVADTGQPDTSR